MPRKRKVWWLAEAIRLDSEERSSREIKEILAKKAKTGQKVPGQSTIFTKVREAKGGAPSSTPAESAPPAPPPPTPEPLDESPMEPEDLVGLLTGLLRQQTALAQQLAAQEDHQGAQRATRTAASIAAQLAKQQARKDEGGDVVRVSAEAMQAAADRAVKGLHTLAQHVEAERAAWPRCPGCGRPNGEFPAAERSPLRALVERLVGVSP
jgi:hypothetical protein